MLDFADLRRLTQWCRRRRMHWMPGRGPDGEAAILLSLDAPPAGARAGGATILLLADEDGFTLLSDAFTPLAAASDLTALLDAVDGGVAESAGPARIGRGAPELRVA
ncbi:MAG: hypothetical protein KGJ41_15055 [Rhodospirillales bacterium]|nr:hypothetical protein [Rhodospirillales bacterium]MDE2576086.1 hypothetical protein [Rhodospirillales bacterium]